MFQLNRVMGIKIGNAVDGEDHVLAIDDELLSSGFKRGFDDPWVPFGPVIAATG
jgi:hypothetical protein